MRCSSTHIDICRATVNWQAGREHSGVTRGGADRPGWHHPKVDTRMKTNVFVAEFTEKKTLDNTMSEDGSCEVVTRRQLKKGRNFVARSKKVASF